MTEEDKKQNMVENFTMSFGDHLEDLRKRILIGLIGPVLLALLCLVFGEILLGIICLPLITVQKSLGMAPQLYVFTAQGGFTVYMKVGVILGVLLGAPWMIYQLWLFISRGLYPSEKRFVVYLVPSSVFLALMGILFMYFIMLPIMLLFLLSFSSGLAAPVNKARPITKPLENYFFYVTDSTSPFITDETQNRAEETEQVVLPKFPILTEPPENAEDGTVWIDPRTHELKAMLGGEETYVTLRGGGLVAPMMQVNEYISFVTWLAIAFAISFQLPLVMLLLAYTGIVDYATMSRAWRFVLVAILLFAALLTPADPISLVLLATPMIGLYYAGLAAVRIIVGTKPSIFGQSADKESTGD